MSDSGKIKCPACDKVVSKQMPNCPFCTQPLAGLQSGSATSETSAEDTAEVAGAIAELEAAKDQLRRSKPTFTSPTHVTGPISAFISLFKPAYGGGAVQIVEIVLAVAALPAILIGVISTTLGVKRWGRMSSLFVLLPTGLVALVAWKMKAPIAFPVLLVSLVAFGLKAVIGMTARVRQLGR